MNQLLFIGIGKFFWIVQEGFVDGVDLRSLQFGDLGEEFLVAEVVVGIFVVEGYKSFVGKEDFPGRWRGGGDDQLLDRNVLVSANKASRRPYPASSYSPLVPSYILPRDEILCQHLG